MNRFTVKEKNYFLLTISLCLLITGIRLAALFYNNIPLWVDEAQYWAWSKSLEMGYFSKPPFIAWAIYLTTHMLGNEEFGIRFSAAIFHFFASIAIYFLGSDLLGKKAGFYSALIYITLPAVTFSSMFISTDAPLMCFWAIALFALIRNIKYPGNRNEIFFWALFAVAVGCGLLSKYTMAAFVLFSFAAIFFTQPGLRKFRLDFIIANSVAFLIFLPNLVWNYQNHFVSFVHTENNVLTGGMDGSVKFLDTLGFIGGQILVFGPAIIVFVMAVFLKDSFSSDHKELKRSKNILMGFSVPLLIIGIVISLMSGSQAHWAAPAYIAASVMVAGYIVLNGKYSWFKIIIAFNVVVLILSLDVKGVSSLVFGNKSPLDRVFIWYKAAKPLEEIMKNNPQAVIVSDERKIITPLMYSLRDQNGNPEKIYKWNPQHKLLDHYDLTMSFNGTGQDVVFVTRTNLENELTKSYAYVGFLKQPTKQDPFYVFLLKGQK